MALNPVKAGFGSGIAALFVLFGCNSLQNATAEGETRSLSFHHVHTNEELTVTYKVNGRYDEEALKKINWVMRDWRKNEPTKMDPHAIDVLWEVHREVSAKEAIWIICGYRSPATNSMLRSRSGGVAKFSQHMLGKAIDFYIPGVPLDQLREAGLRAQRGGVGFYPSSNFVHLDTGSVRHWPRMPEAQLARVMAKGPLRHGGSDRIQVASVPNPVEPITKLLGVFGDSHSTAARTRATDTAARPEAIRAAAIEHAAPRIEKPAERPAVVAAAVPLPRTRPAAKPATFEVASATSTPAQLRPAQLASLVPTTSVSSNDIINERGFWHGLAAPDATQVSVAVRTGTPARRPAGTEIASADPVSTGSLAPWPLPERIERTATPGALAYAPSMPPVASKPALAQAAPRTLPAVAPDTTIAVKRSGNRPSVVSSSDIADAGGAKPGTRYNDPWLRAMIVSPSAQGFMSTSLLGEPDYRNLGPYLQKPTASVMITFSDDPHLGMSSETFSGSAVVFVSTVTFAQQRTASLR